MTDILYLQFVPHPAHSVVHLHKHVVRTMVEQEQVVCLCVPPEMSWPIVQHRSRRNSWRGQNLPPEYVTQSRVSMTAKEWLFEPLKEFPWGEGCPEGRPWGCVCRSEKNRGVPGFVLPLASQHANMNIVIIFYSWKIIKNVLNFSLIHEKGACKECSGLNCRQSQSCLSIFWCKHVKQGRFSQNVLILEGKPRGCGHNRV